jgi:hypothetical protein
VTIEPDTKDWTWVLSRPCPECGFRADSVRREEVADRVRASAAPWQEVLRRADAARRPRPTTWSPVEYACHVRDVHELYLTRLERMLTEDDPLYDNWDQDATALECRYDEQRAEEVAPQLAAAAEALAARFDDVVGEQWERPGRRSDGARFTVDTFARYLLHDLEHHLWDVR